MRLASRSISFFSLSMARAMSTSTSSSQTSRAVMKKMVPGLKNGMDYVQLGDSDLMVSKVCMGTMTFGKQNTIDEGVEQLNRAFDHYGVNFLDTAEMYPVPTEASTQGRTDRAVAQFLRGRARKDIILATKVAGRSERINWLPRNKKGSFAELSREQIIESVYASLDRLGTDYIDLLQIHWPDRYVGGMFGQEDFDPEQYEKAPTPHSFEEQLGALQEVVMAGKVRYIGVSNETPYGVCIMAFLAKNFPDLYPKIVSIQNNYSLVHRKDFEAGLAEACYHQNVGLLAYSPLAGGSLSGKYQGLAEAPKGSRFGLFPGFMDRYRNSLNSEAVSAYCDLAQQCGLSPAQFALSWCYHRPLVTSTIIGATTMEQLDENLKAYDVRLGQEVHDKIKQIYRKYTDPTKAHG